MVNEQAFRKTVDSGHRVGLPQEIWKDMGIREGDKMDVWVENGVICMRKANLEFAVLSYLVMVMEKAEEMPMEPERYAKTLEKLEEVKNLIMGD